jgi:hypothetical protein
VLDALGWSCVVVELLDHAWNTALLAADDQFDTFVVTKPNISSRSDSIYFITLSGRKME